MAQAESAEPWRVWKSVPLYPVSLGYPSNACTSPLKVPHSTGSIFLHHGHAARINSFMFLSNTQKWRRGSAGCL